MNGELTLVSLCAMTVDPYLGKVRDAIKMLDRQVDVIVRFLQAMKSGKKLFTLCFVA